MPAVTRNTPKLTLEGAQLVLAAALARAAEIKMPMDIAVVDDGGHLLAFARMDGAKLSSVEIAISKAHCAAIRRLPSAPRDIRRTGSTGSGLTDVGAYLLPHDQITKRNRPEQVSNDYDEQWSQL